MATILALLAGLHGIGGIVAALGVVSGLAPLLPALRAQWKPILVGAAGIVGFGLLLAWHVSKVAEARKQEQLVCTLEKKQSREDADEIDRAATEQSMADHLNELEAERLRTLAAQAQAEEYQNEIAALPATVRACRAATDADIRRLLGH